MKSALTVAIALFSFNCADAQRYTKQDSAHVAGMANHILLKGRCYDDLKVLCKKIGNRISGSPQAEKAVRWAYYTMKDAGFDSVWLQPVMVPVWKRGSERLSINFGKPGDFKDVTALSIGNTQGTNGKELEADVIMVPDIETFNQLPAIDIEGKIIFFNYRFRQNLINTFEGYIDAGKYRWTAPNLASARGAAGVIIRSVSTGADDFPHTGSMRYADTVKHIPVMAIGNLTADKLERACVNRQVKAQIESECHMEGMALSYNVIGQLNGTAQPDKYIVVGGHLDSWDVGEGAHDDGAGCVQSIEVLRTYKQMGLRPRHSIRAVMFMNEENGLKGGIAYADSALARKEHHIFAIESDAGGFVPRGFEFEISAEGRAIIKGFEPLFAHYGVHQFDSEGGGADISPLKKQNVPLAELMPDPQRYFDVHHTDADVFESVNHRELKLGALALTMLVYVVDNYEPGQ